MESCPFCNVTRAIKLSNDAAIAVDDGFPVTQGHMLVIPKRHVPMVTDLTPNEYQLCFDLVRQLAPIILDEMRAAGLNIGVNCGTAAGQTVMHAHIHLIPRYEGDVVDPRGGVRGVIPNKQKY